MDELESLNAPRSTTFPPPPGRSPDGVWGTTTYVGPLTIAVALAAIPSLVGPFLILMFCPLDQTDVYKLKGQLFTADGKYYKEATGLNFHVMKSEHVVGGIPPGLSPNTDGRWGTTQHVGALTWSMAIVALPSLLGPFIILLFMPLDNHDIYMDGNDLYLADGTWFKTASSKNFEIRKSAHTENGAPKGLLADDGIWGTTTYIGPMTISLFFCALPTFFGSILILMFFPVDRTEVFSSNDGRLYLPNGTVYKNATSKNFYIRKSEHTNGTPLLVSGGEWGTTTYVGPMTLSFFICAIPSIFGAVIILMFLPLDSEEVYKANGNLYLADATMYKAASGLNYHQKEAKHIRVVDDDEEVAELL